MTNDQIKIDVLDQGYVELVDYMGDDNAPIDAARVSFDKAAENYTDEQNDRLANYLKEHDHGSPFEMVVYKFRIHAPVIVWWHFVRHRIASYNFVSGRYVEFREDEFYNPQVWRRQATRNKQGSVGEISMEQASVFTIKAVALQEQAFALYEEMLEAGVAREQARLVLPFAATYYTAIVQMNARSLGNFLKLRCGDDSQWEIRQYAEAMRDIVTKTHPRTMK